MSSPKWLCRMMVAVVALVLGGAPQMLQAQQATPAPAVQTPSQGQTPAPAVSDDQNPQPATPGDQNLGTSGNNATPDPSKGPVAPSNENQQELPSAPSATQQSQTNPSSQEQSPQVPTGAAAAPAVRTAGGAASRPAGTAIAPAKQHQMRGILIKVGAIAAAGAAVGIVYALSRSAPSVPPGASTLGTAVH